LGEWHGRTQKTTDTEPCAVGRGCGLRLRVRLCPGDIRPRPWGPSPLCGKVVGAAAVCAGLWDWALGVWIGVSTALAADGSRCKFYFLDRIWNTKYPRSLANATQPHRRPALLGKYTHTYNTPVPRYTVAVEADYLSGVNLGRVSGKKVVSTVYRVPCTVYRVPCTVYRVPCTRSVVDAASKI